MTRYSPNVPVMTCSPTQALAAWDAAGLPRAHGAVLVTMDVLDHFTRALGTEGCTNLFKRIPESAPLPIAVALARVALSDLGYEAK